MRRLYRSVLQESSALLTDLKGCEMSIVQERGFEKADSTVRNESLLSEMVLYTVGRW